MAQDDHGIVRFDNLLLAVQQEVEARNVPATVTAVADEHIAFLLHTHGGGVHTAKDHHVHQAVHPAGQYFRLLHIGVGHHGHHIAALAQSLGRGLQVVLQLLGLHAVALPGRIHPAEDADLHAIHLGGPGFHHALGPHALGIVGAHPGELRGTQHGGAGAVDLRVILGAKHGHIVFLPIHHAHNEIRLAVGDIILLEAMHIAGIQQHHVPGADQGAQTVHHILAPGKTAKLLVVSATVL